MGIWQVLRRVSTLEAYCAEDESNVRGVGVGLNTLGGGMRDEGCGMRDAGCGMRATVNLKKVKIEKD